MSTIFAMPSNSPVASIRTTPIGALRRVPSSLRSTLPGGRAAIHAESSDVEMREWLDATVDRVWRSGRAVRSRSVADPDAAESGGAALQRYFALDLSPATVDCAGLMAGGRCPHQRRQVPPTARVLRQPPRRRSS
jgi:hypothetical protein